MTLFAYLAGSDVGHKVRLNAIGLTNNADGSVGMGSIVFDDADGTLTVRGWMKVVVKETACTSAPVLFSGYVGPRTYSRNIYRQGAARFIDTTLVDENAILHCRLITGSDGKRPAETHDVRVNWLLNSAYLSGLIADTSLVDTATMRPFEEADYRGQYADDVLNDVAGPIFRTFFVYPTQPNGTRGLFFDTPTSTVGTSTLTISNVLSDQSATCFPPSIDATLSRDPSEVYSRIRYTYANGTIIEDDTSAVTDFFTDNGIGTRGLQVNNSRVGLASTARSMSQTLLSRADGENDTITVTVILPAASVGLIREGQRIGVRFTHLPGYETLTYTRVTSRNIRQTEGTNEHYDVTLELNTHGLSSAGGSGSPAPGNFPHQGCGAWSLVQQATPGAEPDLPSPPSAGNLLVIIAAQRGTTVPSYTGFTTAESVSTTGSDSGGTFVYYKIADGSEANIPDANPSSTRYVWYMEWNQAGTLGNTSDRNQASAATILTTSIAAGSGSLVFAAFQQAQGAMTIALDAGFGLTSLGQSNIQASDQGPHTVAGYNVSASGAYAPTATPSNIGFGRPQASVLVAFTCSNSADPPAPGQVVPWTVVTMAGAVGTTEFPYADGSLLVKVDGLLISTASYTETSPAAGTFTLSWTPATDEVVTVQYLGR